MNESTRRYPSKIMLAGEYGVVVGGSALTIPYPRFYAQVRPTDDIPPGRGEAAEQSARYLAGLYGYIRDLPAGTFHAGPDLEHVSRATGKYWIEMNIPVGYGLGSSGAVSAAVYDLFFPGAGDQDLTRRRSDLAAIESYFHGRSSGVDALTCHTATPLHFMEDGTIRQVTLDPSELPGGYRFFLLDSGEKFDTGPLVKKFLKRMEKPSFASSIRDEYLLLNRKLIEILLRQREADPAMLVRLISDFQLHHMREMIPEQMIDEWIGGLVTNEYYYKLNGSGGGFILGIAHHSARENLDNNWQKDLIWV
jgi:mevalonate kinase